MTRSICSVDTCDKPVRQQGFCSMHFGRWRRNGDPLITRRPRQTGSCSIETCHSPARTRGWCTRHYDRWRKYGDPLGGGPDRIVGNDSVRFWSKVTISDPTVCWPWTGGLNEHGYGVINLKGAEHTRVHRYAYELSTGPIPTTMEVDHQCHNRDPDCPGGDNCLHRRCCNPAHLETATHRDNTFNGKFSERRGACRRNHPWTTESTYTTKQGHRRCRICRQLVRKGLV